MAFPDSRSFPGGGDFRPHVGDDDRVTGAYEGDYLDPAAEAAWGRLYGDAVPVAPAEPETQAVSGTDEELLRLWSHAIDNEDYALAARIQAEASGVEVADDVPFDFHSEVIIYGSTKADPHVLAALRTQSNCYSEMLRCEAAGDIAGSAAAQKQLDFFTQNNPDLIARANAIRREFVIKLAKDGFFTK